ncbi:MAG: hypothetical protein HEQ35_22465 [Gloeotrichia echinulata IR180]
MDSQTFVQIHEFSTGISFKGTADKWVSMGFTGQYINATINPIPPVVETSIRNKEFKVAEGAYSDQPAIIGRVVGSGESAWSVVAIVTRGQDEKGRSASFYRYFLCEGDNGLPKILAWIEAYKKQEGKMPVFNPFKQREVGKPNPSYFPVTPFDLEDEVKSWLSNQVVPVIIPAEKYTPEILNQLATENAKTNNQPIAWAFNVEALEAIGRFQIIQAASPQAYELFQRLKNSSPKALPPVVSDEQALISGIRAFMNNPSTVKSQHVEAIANALSNDKVSEKYWREIFDAQGADSAIKGTYTPQYVKLLTLRAIIIPETLPEYLTWLDKGDKQYKTYELAENCQNQISNLLNRHQMLSAQLERNLSQGFQVLLSLVFQGQEISLSKAGLWDKFSKPFIRHVEYDLTLISKNLPVRWQSLSFQLTDKFWQDLRNELKFYFNQPNFNHSPKDKYQPVAKFFDNLEAARIAAFFYQLGDGEVPKRIFKRLQINDWETEIYGIKVKRERTPDEQVLYALKYLFNANVPLPLLLILILISFLLGSIFSPFTSPSDHGNNSVNSTQTTTPPPTPTIQTKTLNNALKDNNFKVTSTAITKLVNKVKTAWKLDDEKIIINLLQEVLKDPTLQYAGVINQGEKQVPEEQKAKWVTAIYNYQLLKKSTADGIVYDLVKEQEGDTYKQLKEDIEKLKKQKFNDLSTKIKSIVEDLNNNSQPNQNVVQELKNFLKDPTLGYAGVITQGEKQVPEEQKAKWLTAIYKYQNSDNPNNANGFSVKEETYTKLKQEITNKIQPKP